MSLGRYILRRLVYTVPTVFGALLLMFIVTRVLPGDPVLMILGPAHSSPENVEALSRMMGLDRPLPIQFLTYVGHVLRGDLGYSWRAGSPVSKELLRRFPATFELTTFAFLLMVVISLPLGIIAGYYRNRLPDHMISIFTVIGVSMPIFWFGLLLIYFFFYLLNLAPPPMGRLSPELGYPPTVTGLLLIDTLLAGDLKAFLGALKQLILPGLTLSFFNWAIIVRTLKADLIETLEEDYIRTAKAMGVGLRSVLFRHALRNALLPTVTMAGAIYGGLLGGSVLTEVIFAWPGVGSFAVESIQYLDYAGLQGFILFYVLIFAVINLIVDISYRLIDPRVQLE
ncbi:MAG: ABC transporter permease [Deltaproteobacteria bacterium]|nr:ABC transporter permease [Deltaproteobacteria bacterium]MBW2016922.1 ABC transporter permease [Deltaproteobacteria bacterium]MBW2129386.1 ABC transporter permease [Deltaproteobacteria bacterium]MBW2303728.1 ABC transporter permease [Deltaproteobacteria bacterium]